MDRPRHPHSKRASNIVTSFAKRLKKLKKKKLRVRYDDCCPKCSHNLGWDNLAELFDLIRLDVSTSQSFKYVCPECDKVLNVTLIVEFEVKETRF